MWDLPKPKKPFYRRWWFTLPLATLILVSAVGSIIFFQQKAIWDARAREFNYDKLDQMESTSVVFDRNENVLARMFIQNRDRISVDAMSPELLRALIAAEDARFYEHNGVDVKGIIRAMVRNIQAGKTVQGASTITQQLARNTFTDELPATDRSQDRKLLEMAVAMEIERRCDKRKILELYLNRVFFGAGFYGAEAAARGYFGKNAKDLTLSESAVLAGLLRSPSKLSPWKDHDRCMQDRNRVLNRALEEKIITQVEYDTAMKEDVVIKNRKRVQQESYAAAMVAQQVGQLVGAESSRSDGYRIYTTIDLNLQKQAEIALREQLEAVERKQGYAHQKFSEYDTLYKAEKRGANGNGESQLPLPDYLQGTVLMLDNSTGAILAMVGGRDFQHSEYNRVMSSRRPAGTAFKPLVYATGFEQGLFPGTAVEDKILDNRQVMIGGTTGILGEWGPERADNQYEGVISARTALVKSKNSATVRFGTLMQDGIPSVIKLSKLAGIESPLRPFPATYLGSSEITPMELTLANTIFPNLGSRPVAPFIIERIEEKDGRVIFRAPVAQVRVVKPTTAYEVHSCLSQVLDRGTADRAYTDFGLKKFDLGGKTGTAYNFTDLWFVGYSKAVTCGVWVGFDKPRPIMNGLFSNEVALPVWTQTMKATFAKWQPTEIAKPEGLRSVKICSSSGYLAVDACGTASDAPGVSVGSVYYEMASRDQTPKEVCPVHGGGLVAPPTRKTPGGAPMARPVFNIAGIKTVELKGPTVIGEDPYNSTQAFQNAMAAQQLIGQVAPLSSSKSIPTISGEEKKEPAVRKAIPVAQPAERASVKESPIEVAPPEPIQF